MRNKKNRLGPLGWSGMGPVPGPPPAQLATYRASAVHFDVGTSLSRASLVATDSADVSFSYWIKIAGVQAGNASIWVVDPVNLYETYQSWFFGDPTKVKTSLGDDNNTLHVDNTAIGVETWSNVLVSFNCTTGVGKIYVNDTDVTGTIHFSGALVPLFNGLPFYFGDDSFAEGSIMDVADVWIAPNVSLLTAGDISVANRRKFISAGGKPVNPSGFPTSAILFSGNASTFGTNQGAGGAFTLTGLLTNASTSPSD